MIKPGTLCCIVRCTGDWNSVNNYIVTVVDKCTNPSHVQPCYGFTPSVPVPVFLVPYLGGDEANHSNERYLQPINDPDCKIDDVIVDDVPQLETA